MSKLKYVLIELEGGRVSANWDLVLKSAIFFFECILYHSRIIFSFRSTTLTLTRFLVLFAWT